MNEHTRRAGIPTTYRGITYRSRLEARWAAFFDGMDWWHTYEPFDADGYVPDFMIQGDSPLLVEVKPAVTYRDYVDMTSYIWEKLDGFWTHDILVLGLTPLPALGAKEHWRDVSGLLGEYQQTEENGPFDWVRGLSRWCRCGVCSEVGVYHEDQSFRVRPCGHFDGNKFLGDLSIDTIKAAWNEATNAVKWKAT